MHVQFMTLPRRSQLIELRQEVLAQLAELNGLLVVQADGGYVRRSKSLLADRYWRLLDEIQHELDSPELTSQVHVDCGPGAAQMFSSINVAETVEKLIGGRGYQSAAEQAATIARAARGLKEDDAAADWEEVYRQIFSRRGT